MLCWTSDETVSVYPTTFSAPNGRADSSSYRDTNYYYYYFFFILRRMGKNKALAHPTSFRVFSYASCVDLTQLLSQPTHRLKNKKPRLIRYRYSMCAGTPCTLSTAVVTYLVNTRQRDLYCCQTAVELELMFCFV